MSLISLCAICEDVTLVAVFFLPFNKLTHFYSVTLFEIVVDFFDFFFLLLPLQGHKFQSASKQLLTVARNLLWVIAQCKVHSYKTDRNI